MPYTELTDRPGTGRAYTEAVRAAIGDAGATGRVRLDAIARWLQDAAYYDLVDAGWERPGPWLVRRLRIRVERFPVFPERLALTTWCSGDGRADAERRTSVRGEEGARIESAALWVALNPVTQRPAPSDSTSTGPAPVALRCSISMSTGSPASWSVSSSSTTAQ